MKNLLPRCTAIKALLFAALLAFGGAAWAAQVAGVITRLSGPLMARKADGSVKLLAVRSEVESGDTLVSEKNTYAQIKFVDNSEITLRPGTTFKVEDFSYDEGKPDADKASYQLVKGGLRSITGLMGKRNKEKFSLKTPTATIGIRGTTFIVQYVAPAEPARADMPGAPPALPPGLHLSVTDGAIIVTNHGGALGFQAGQFGYVPSIDQPPVILPQNPGLQFAPPPSFEAGIGLAGGPGGAGPENAVDCVVR
jgi:hypothetical protein